MKCVDKFARLVWDDLVCSGFRSSGRECVCVEQFIFLLTLHVNGVIIVNTEDRTLLT